MYLELANALGMTFAHADEEIKGAYYKAAHVRELSGVQQYI